MLGFRDDMLGVAVDELLKDVKNIEKKLSSLSERLHQNKYGE